MSVFSEVKEHLTARQAAEYYGLQVKRNGMACCPFHNDKYPSMKIDRNYHCFACGVGGDAIDYVSRMFGVSQYDAALKLVEDFSLPISISCSRKFNEQEKARIRKEKAEKERIVHIKERFNKWCNQSVEVLRNCLSEIEKTGFFLRDKPPDIVFNVKFCMDDENQRRTWEYLQGITRKDGSYGKILSDAFVAVLDGQIQTGTDKAVSESVISFEQDADILEKILDRVLERKFCEMLQELQKSLAEQINSSLNEYVSAFHSDAETLTERTDVGGMEQMHEPELSEDMMAFAFAMGE